MVTADPGAELAVPIGPDGHAKYEVRDQSGAVLPV